MCKLIGTFLFCCVATHLLSQNPCGNGRYITDIFPQVAVTEDISFGSNLQPTSQDPNAVQQLYLDLYEPVGDSLAQRPLIIFAFGGGFITGSRKDADISTLCQRFAKRGYVTASIDYRLTPNIIITQNARDLYLAIIKAVHDMKAAIRFFRKDADSLNVYRIHPSQVFVGGISAGGVTAIHTTYFDESEVPSFIAGDTAAIGGLIGLSGNPGYSTAVTACINLCGAIGDTSWMNNAPIPIISAHGTADQVVPYGSTDDFFGASFVVHGSGSIDIHASGIGMTSKLLTWQGVDHAPFVPGLPNADQFMEETISHISQSLNEYVCIEASTSIGSKLAERVSVYPQPAKEYVQVDFSQSSGRMGKEYTISLMDISGNLLYREMTNETEIRVYRGTMPAGLYFLTIEENDSGLMTRRKILFHESGN